MHQDLVGFELRGVEHHFDAVAQHPLRRLDIFVVTYCFYLTLARCFLHQLVVHSLFGRRLDSQFAHAAQCCQYRLLRRDIHSLFLRSGDGYGRVGVYQGFCYVVGCLQRQHRQHSLYEVVLPLCTGHRLAVLEMADALACQRDVLTGVTLVVVFLHRIELLALYAVQLTLGEAVAVHLLQLVEQIVQRLCLPSLFGDIDGVESVHQFHGFAVLAAAGGERCFRVERQLRETVVQHVTDQFAHEVKHILLRRSLQRGRHLVELILQRDTAALSLGVGYDSHQRLVIMVDGVDRPLAVVSTARHVGPEGLYLLLNAVHVDVAHYDDCLVVRAVPLMVVVTQCLVGEVVDDGGVAYHVALGVLRARVHLCVQLPPYTTACRAACAPLLQYHAALGVYLLVQQREGAAPVVHHQQRAVDDTLAIGRHVAQTIYRLVNRGVGIDVTAEVDTYRLKIVDDSLALKMLGTVEGHMLQEVGQTVLVVLLQDGTYRLRDVELATLFGLLVVTDVVGQSVVQLAVANLRVHRQFLRRLLRREGRSCQQQHGVKQ